MKLKQMELQVAYFSMEIMMESDIPSYAGGLGVLAGDLLRSCADMEVPAIGVSLVYSGTVYAQAIQRDGTQVFREVDWRKMEQFTKLPYRITLRLKGEDVRVGCWRYDFVGLHGFVVPAYLLDTNLEENSEWARSITTNLYEDKWELRFAQEALLGVGGVKMVRELGYHRIKTFHMNEGHSTMVSLALLEENEYVDDRVRQQCVFTTHTPIPEGHDKFDYTLAHSVAETYIPWHIKKIASEDIFSMTHLGMNMSKMSLAVSRKHRAVTEHIFPGHSFGYVTNGVHHRSWIGHFQQDLYQKYMPGFLDDPMLLAGSDRVPDEALWETHQTAKRELLGYVNKHLISHSPMSTGVDHTFHDDFEDSILTIAIARRPVPYKRPLLLYKDVERLRALGKNKLQIIQCGRGSPTDENAKKIIDEIIDISRALHGDVRVDYLENYSPKIARLLVSGVDVWLNTPMQPLEASGTSGMKAAMNGVLNFSVPDGWWIEGYIAGVTGWAIGDGSHRGGGRQLDAESLYEQLGGQVVPMFYNDQDRFLSMMINSIALNGSFFNTQRMMQEYVTKTYFR